MAYETSNPKRGLTWCGGVVALVGALLSGAPLGAQVTTGSSVLELKSGLYSFSGTARVTAAEVGSLQSSSEVQIEFRDAADKRLSISSGRISRANPFTVQLAVPGGERVRVLVRITGVIAILASRPSVTLEDLAPGLGLVIETKPPCAPRHSVGGGAQPNCGCGGWQVDQFTTSTGSN